MPHRIRPGLVRTLVHLAVLVLPRLVRALVPVAGPVSGRPPVPRVPRTTADTAVPPPDVRRLGGRRYATAHEPAPTTRVRPYLVVHEQRSRRRALALALDGIDVGPWVIHGHRVGQPAVIAGPLGVAA
ncbi:hypothetical protein ACFVIY_11055 [Streptomyces sp. NPDC127166]|uniref:hypothetical protein n=1 Tax=Streptomyces sp. NPDC127166 TaxID=3345380 RepID=UPI0036345923